MAIEILEYVAYEQDTYGVKITFADAADVAFTPNDLTFTLSDRDGNTINSLEDVPITPLSTSIYVVLSGDDLALADPDAKYEWRVLTIKGTYTDSILGEDLPIAREFHFKLMGQVAVP